MDESVEYVGCVDESVDGVGAGFLFPLVDGVDASVDDDGCGCGLERSRVLLSEKQRGPDLTDRGL